ncbi:tryptophan synthase subunit alpha [Homoserinimonas hongtaonis]|uniref:Tryptophan synthase alpha chain n=1 Tax=Homoserinimonas hongtaonis TaxID=2079791 RepID=A0A2U1SYJ9_9MICO|nr:tryptophan synthase subunit alpha [Salinibacterium hongtaonis]AWB89257.1 tryptophan synthase subunit alpha [Salinibacterium hongtaonis]PWB96705.1 tryptophan synthase subunit alpha [Salinibacterium hongtaonis]
MTTTSIPTVSAAISTRRDAGSGALIGYLPVGFPDLQTSIDAAVALAENGVDVLELGVPYSDPVMDGLVIQKATQQALEQGFRLRDVFTAVEAIRSRVDIPVLVMTYWNPVVQYGVDRFADDLVSAGGSGLITPDITPDSAADWIATSDRTGLDRVFLAAPTSTDARLRDTVAATRGFVYAVSTMGITGLRVDLDAAARTLVARLTDAGSTTTCVGIGISTPDQVNQVLHYADGAIVGSVLVKSLAEDGIAGLVRTASALARGTSLV